MRTLKRWRSVLVAGIALMVSGCVITNIRYPTEKVYDQDEIYFEFEVNCLSGSGKCFDDYLSDVTLRGGGKTVFLSLYDFYEQQDGNDFTYSATLDLSEDRLDFDGGTIIFSVDIDIPLDYISERDKDSVAFCYKKSPSDCSDWE